MKYPGTILGAVTTVILLGMWLTIYFNTTRATQDRNAERKGPFNCTLVGDVYMKQVYKECDKHSCERWFRMEATADVRLDAGALEPESNGHPVPHTFPLANITLRRFCHGRQRCDRIFHNKWTVGSEWPCSHLEENSEGIYWVHARLTPGQVSSLIAYTVVLWLAIIVALTATLDTWGKESWSLPRRVTPWTI
jgi:hypothetical protein